MDLYRIILVDDEEEVRKSMIIKGDRKHETISYYPCR